MNWFRPSGGLMYHWRAWRQSADWQEFRSELSRWLNEWPIQTTHLILIGPSGGYTLPTEWLKRFTQITAYDLDPLAPWFFRWQHSGVNVTFHRQDVFWNGSQFHTEALQQILRQHPQAAVLFCNVLGQLLLEHPVDDSSWEDFLFRLRLALRERPWASYHDLYTEESGELIDHLMDGDWSNGLSARQMRWPLSSRSTHIVAAVTNDSTPL